MATKTCKVCGGTFDKWFKVDVPIRINSDNDPTDDEWHICLKFCPLCGFGRIKKASIAD